VWGSHLKALLKALAPTAHWMRFQVFGDAAARRFGTLKAELRRRGTPKADFDLSIAAIAFDLEATLVSDDRAFHEDPIPSLAVENWLLG